MELAPIPAEAATETRARFTIEARALSNAVKLLSGKVADKRSTIPILSCLLIDVSPCGRVTITATDLDVMATFTLAADATEEIEPGAVCLDADALAKVLAKVAKNSDRVRIEAAERNRATLKAGRNSYNVPSLPRDDFPMIWMREVDCAGVIERAQFMADMKALAPAMSTETHREYLCGIAMQVRDMAGRDRFTMSATDGYMMAAASRPIPAGLEAWADAILLRKAVALLLAADKVAGESEGVTLSRSGATIAAEFGALRIVSKLVNDTYPNWPRAFEAIAAPIDGEGQGALFPDLLPEWPLARTEALQKVAAGAIEWRGGLGGVMGECAADPDMMWAAMYRLETAGLNASYDAGLTVNVAGDREYKIATGSKIELTREQVAALCGDRLWEVLEFPGPDGKPRYVSAWVWEQGDSRLLCVGKDGRCPKADAPREYVTRAEVEAALAGEAMPVIEAPVPVAIPTPVAPEAVSAPQTAEECAEAAPMLPDTPEAPAIDATPASCQPEPETLTIWQRGARLGLTQGDEESNGEFMLRVEALEAALPAQAVAGKRTPAHERAIRRAWAERKARRMAEAERDKVMAAYNASGDARRALRKERDDWEGRAMRMAGKRRRAVVQARNAKHTARHFLHESLANYDRRINAEHEARVALAAREDLKRMHEAAEARAASAEAENAQLWAEIEALTAPAAAIAA